MSEKLARVFRVFQNRNYKKEESRIKFNHKNQDIKKIVLSNIKKMKYQKKIAVIKS